MGGTKGNKNALGNKGGRPVKWTSSFVAEEIEWMKKYLISSEGENIVFKKELCHLRKYSHSQFTTYVTKFELFEAIKEIDEILEVRIAKAGMTNEINTTMAIFCLKNNHGWKDKTENETTFKGNGLTVNFVPAKK